MGKRGRRGAESDDDYEESPSQRQRVDDDDDDDVQYEEEPESQFVKGAIVKVVLRNFMTYGRPVEIRPGPRLNLVLGPNGTGKSSFVCAMCIGLGFPTKASFLPFSSPPPRATPRLLGENTNTPLGDMLSRSARAASRPREGNPRVRQDWRAGSRDHHLAQPGSWRAAAHSLPHDLQHRGVQVQAERCATAVHLPLWKGLPSEHLAPRPAPGKSATIKEVAKKMQEMNVQMDNLCQARGAAPPCRRARSPVVQTSTRTPEPPPRPPYLPQFLPQDRVVAFAQLSPVELLEETEKAVGAHGRPHESRPSGPPPPPFTFLLGP